jgi:hypothetical protein
VEQTAGFLVNEGSTGSGRTNGPVRGRNSILRTGKSLQTEIRYSIVKENGRGFDSVLVFKRDFPLVPMLRVSILGSRLLAPMGIGYKPLNAQLAFFSRKSVVGMTIWSKEI